MTLVYMEPRPYMPQHHLGWEQKIELTWSDAQILIVGRMKLTSEGLASGRMAWLRRRVADHLLCEMDYGRTVRWVE